ncbi:tRNA uridine(34) 5-carboxymethylaminomethyl modification radical SAM/GNAT enzyme Elp3 [Candidatus Micrarchaeota archaeon]|nr:tRNA uridine(34) 5-carboxymethylaminomethyl modification radical SAM/GNAT enzyme Elp3 [Candidatus Micrarchaeota archaeon]
MDVESAAREVAELLENGMCERELVRLKKKVGKKYGMAHTVRNSEVLAVLPKKKRTKEILRLLLKRPMRTISGVAPVAVMTASNCPHGKCSYCPRGDNAPQSYTGFEPATMRGQQNKFDAFEQTKSRIEQLEAIGHNAEKIELIIMGGTFPSQEKKYKDDFVLGCFNAMNVLSGKKKSKTIAEAHEKNEKAKHRCVGLTVETRPDWCKEKHVDEMFSWGATRVELGVQTLDEKVYEKVERGHTIADVVDATRICKDSALKMCFHMMPGLYADEKKDVGMFKQLFEDERFKPDMLKIYPCLVLKGTKLYGEWRKGKFKPYNTEEAVETIVEATRYFPKYVRVMRVQRDIPSNITVAGVDKNNLRQMVEKELEARGLKCACIRCREAGLQGLKKGVKFDAEAFELTRMNYEASGGSEVFLSFEDDEKDALAGFVRLRVPSKGKLCRSEITRETGLIRELHVYGEALKIGEKKKEAVQHEGFGEKLLKRAEEIASEEFGLSEMVVMSGVGVREYYKKFGYERKGVVYMAKKLV